MKNKSRRRHGYARGEMNASYGDDAAICAEVATEPPWTNIVYVAVSAGPMVDDIRSGRLIDETALKLLSSIGPKRITAAVLRCLAAGRLCAHRESDPNDARLHIIVFTSASRLVN